MAKVLVGSIGVLAPNPFDNESCIKYVKCPTLFIHGEDDDLIPWEHSQVSGSKNRPDFIRLCMIFQRLLIR